MNKSEFLSILKSSLEGEIPSQEIMNHVNYYNEYITDDSRLQQLGNPRLIAKTIIDSYGASKAAAYTQKSSRNKNGYEDGNFSYNKERYESEQRNLYENETRSQYHLRPLPWYYKLAGAVTLIAVLAILVAVGGILLKIAFTVVFPVLLVLFVVNTIVKGIGHR